MSLYLWQLALVVGYMLAELTPKRLKVWRAKKPSEPKEPPPPDVCNHVWSQWSAPEILKIVETTTNLWISPSQSVERVTEGLKQERTCDLCHLYERRLVP